MTTETLLDRLRAATEATIRLAGPRYSPGFTADAPNLPVDALRRVVSALCTDTLFRDRLVQLASGLREVHDRDADLLNELFRHSVGSLGALAYDLETASSAANPAGVSAALQIAQGRLNSTESRLSAHEQDCRSRLRALPDKTKSKTRSATSSRKEQLEAQLRSLRRISEGVYPVADLLKGTEGRAATSGPPVLLLGEWGTGKTHFVCDFALHALRDRVAAIAVLANSLDDTKEPLEEIARRTGLFNSATEFLTAMEENALRTGRRSVILIDALNEGDRDRWRERLPSLFSQMGSRPNVALVVTCRTPFDQELTSPTIEQEALKLTHPGFEDQEFDAQLEFFSFYNLPPLDVPLLAPEFRRPLFLKLMCEGLAKLKKRAQKHQLDGIASGQKGMTYVLEHFVKHAGEEVEERNGLPRLSTWRLLKGDPTHGQPGFAGLLSQKQQEWLTYAEARGQIERQLGVPAATSIQLIRDMIAAGLLIERPRYGDDGLTAVLALPYQRFSDHLIARHLLETGLRTDSEQHVRRSFYANKRLGAVFVSNEWGRGWAEPGIASALMVEFPERVKRLSMSHNLPLELLAYLPRARRLLEPLSEAFTDGLTWRNSASFTSDTERVVRSLLKQGDVDVRLRVFEVLLGLAARPRHPWSAQWLWDFLTPLSIADRDLTWSEFVRLSDETSNVYRVLAWAERAPLASLSDEAAGNIARLALLLTTTTDRGIRDRATRILVRIGTIHWRALFAAAGAALAFNDPYVPERALAAAYGVCMRISGRTKLSMNFVDSLQNFVELLVLHLFARNAAYSTWHALSRSYAQGTAQLLRLLRPRALSRSSWALVLRHAELEESPFRLSDQISDADTKDGEAAIHMDFGNYTMGRLVDGRGNYDMDHPEYARLRRQIADRVRTLGFDRDRFANTDRIIAQYSSAAHQRVSKVDRYGKKYSWIAYFEMYGLRASSGLLSDYPHHEPRPSDADIDPSFPEEIPVWTAPLEQVFRDSPIEHDRWLREGAIPEIEDLLSLKDLDKLPGTWVLLDASINLGMPDGREVRAGVTSSMVSSSALPRVRAELARGHGVEARDLPEPGTDYYTYHGEVPWSQHYGSDVRRLDGAPRRLQDEAFNYFEAGHWHRGIRAEPTTRYFGWESYHSDLNQVGLIAFPSPQLTAAFGLRVVDGSSDLVDGDGRVATIFRRTPGPGFGSFYLFMRRDLVEAYARTHHRSLLMSVHGERTLHVKYFEHRLPTDLQEIIQSDVTGFARAFVMDILD